MTFSRLGVKQADGLDVSLEFAHAQFVDRLGSVGDFKQRAGGFIDAHIGSLSRQNHSDQQFKRRFIVKLRGGRRVGLLQPRKYLCALFSIHTFLSVCVFVVSRLPSMALVSANINPATRKAPGA